VHTFLPVLIDKKYLVIAWCEMPAGFKILIKNAW